MIPRLWAVLDPTHTADLAALLRTARALLPLAHDRRLQLLLRLKESSQRDILQLLDALGPPDPAVSLSLPASFPPFDAAAWSIHLPAATVRAASPLASGADRPKSDDAARSTVASAPPTPTSAPAEANGATPAHAAAARSSRAAPPEGGDLAARSELLPPRHPAVDPGWRGALGLRTAAAHDPAESSAALDAGAVALIWGPVFDARSKPVGGRGLRALATFTAAAPVPVIPIGGIDPHHIAELISAGAWGVAALTPFCTAPDAEAVAQTWIAAIEAATRGMPTSVSGPCDDRDR